MHATLRRYEGVDRTRTEELTLKASQSLVPRLSELPGFNGYYLIQADDGVLTSVSLFDTSAQTDASGSVAASWIRDERFEAVLPNPPKVTAGRVVAEKTNVG
jgi:hypothetical protein